MCWVEYSINTNYVKLSHSVVQLLTLLILSTSRNYNLGLTIHSISCLHFAYSKPFEK